MNGLNEIIGVNKGAKLNKLIGRNVATNGGNYGAAVDKATAAYDRHQKREDTVKAQNSRRTGAVR